MTSFLTKIAHFVSVFINFNQKKNSAWEVHGQPVNNLKKNK